MNKIIFSGLLLLMLSINIASGQYLIDVEVTKSDNGCTSNCGTLHWGLSTVRVITKNDSIALWNKIFDDPAPCCVTYEMALVDLMDHTTPGSFIDKNYYYDAESSINEGYLFDCEPIQDISCFIINAYIIPYGRSLGYYKHLIVPYKRGIKDYTIQLNDKTIFSDGLIIGSCLETYNISISVEDHVELSLNSKTDSITGKLKLNYSNYYNNGKGSPVIQWLPDSIPSYLTPEIWGIKWNTLTLPTTTFSPSGGTITINNLLNYTGCTDILYDKGITMVVKNTLDTPFPEYNKGYGSSVYLKFWDRPKIYSATPIITCQNSTITLVGGYENKECINPNAELEASLNPAANDWVAIKDAATIKLTGSTLLSFNNITDNQTWLGKEIFIRPYKMFKGTKKIIGGYKSIVFLPIPNMTFTPHHPTCPAKEDGSFNITFNDVPSNGAVGGTIPLNISIKKYDLNPIAPIGIDYIPIDTLEKRYYYSTGVTAQLNVTGNSIDINNQFIQDNCPSVSGKFKLSAGIYLISAGFNSADAKCPNSQTFILEEPAEFTQTAHAVLLPGSTQYHVNTGDNAAVVEFTLAGGTPIYNFSETGNAAVNYDYTTTGTFTRNITYSPFTANHTYTIKDVNTCIGSGDNSVTFNRPDDIVISSIQGQDYTCNRADNPNNYGTVSCFFTGGVPNYTAYLYRSDGTSFASVESTTVTTGSVTFNSSNILAGYYYYIQIVDGLNPNYSINSSSVYISQPIQLGLTTTSNSPTCLNGTEGSFTLTPSGGNGGYSYSFIRTEDNSPQINNALPVGTYNILMTDAKGCQFQQYNQPISQPSSPLTIDATYSQPASCATIANGKVKAVVLNYRNTDADVTFKMGSVTLSKTYDAGNNCFYISSLSNTDNSTITVTDAICQASDTVRIPLRDLPFYVTAATSDLAPCTEKNGILTITSANCEGSDFNYSIDGSTFSKASGTSQNLMLKGNSKHTINVTDGLTDCPFILSNINVDVRPDSLRLNPILNIIPASCTTSNSGQVKIEKSSGWGIIHFQISPTDSIKSNTNSVTFYNLYPRVYHVVASDDSLCNANASFTIPVSSDSLNLFSVNSIRAACKGESYTGELKVSCYVNEKKTGYGEVTYTLNSISKSDSTFSNLKSGEYTITAVDERNCQVSNKDSVKFEVNLVAFTIDSLTDQRCTEVKNAKLYLKAHTSRGSNQTFRFVNDGITSDWHSDTISYFVRTAGDYKFEVIDRNNCGTDLTHTIKNLQYAPKPILSLSSAVACANAANGQLVVSNTPNHSVPPYQYQLDSKTKYAGAADQIVTFAGLTKGVHIVTATDTLGCQDTARFVVQVQTDSVHIARIDTTSATCIAAQNGKAKIVASSSDKSNTENKYTFVCNYKTLTGDSIMLNLLPVKKVGLYTVYVTDRYGCANEASFAMGVRKDTLHLLQRTIINAACPDSSDGSVSLARINGDAIFHFQVTSLDNKISRTFYSTDTLVLVNGLPDNTYTISVTDTNHCVAAVNNLTITQPKDIQFVAINQNYIKRKGQPEGWMNASVASGNRKYLYEWFNLADNSSITSGKTVEYANIQLSNRLAGNYLLRVRDTANCFTGTTGWLEKKFQIVEPQNDLALTIKRNRPVSCFGLSDGEFEMKATGGWGNNYQYGLDALQMYADSIFPGQTSETITLFAKDTAGIIISIPVTVTQPAKLTARLASKTDANCFGSADGIVSVDISGGNYLKYFVSSDNQTWTVGNSLSNLPKGDYTIYVRDTLNCNTQVTASIGEPTQIIHYNNHITDTRCGFGNGTITTKISGGIPDYTYQWYKNADILPFSNDSVAGLFSGSYQLSVTDHHGCIVNFPFHVSDITDLTIDTIETQPVTCWGYSDGSAIARLSKGNPPYLLTWPDSTHLTLANGFKTGIYSLWVTDQEKCNVYRDFNIGTPLKIYLSSKTLTNPLCEGVDAGAIDIEAAGSNSTFTYRWNTGSTHNAIKNLSPGEYTVTVTDNQICSNQFGFTLQYQQAIAPYLGKDLTLCKDNTVKLNPGTFNRYQWTSTTGFTSGLPEVSIYQPGSYFVEVTDNDGCVGRDTIKIDQSTTDLQGKLLVATNVEQNDTVVIFEASWPVPDSIKFTLEGCKVIASGLYYREVVFADTGTFTVTLTSYRNDCLDVVSKQVKVENTTVSTQKSQSTKMITTFNVSPNPSDGVFMADIRLSESATINLKLANLTTGSFLDIREYKGVDAYSVSYNLNNLVPGAYILHLQVGKEAKTKTIIIVK